MISKHFSLTKKYKVTYREVLSEQPGFFSRFIANTVEITGTGIVKSFGLPKMTDVEMKRVDLAINELYSRHKMVESWYCKCFSSSGNLHAYQLRFTKPRPSERFDDCAYATI